MTTLTLWKEIEGEGPDLVLIHGWGLHGGIWQTLLPWLTPYFRVHSIDMPGFGRSPVHNGDYTLEYLADSIAAEIPEGAILLGWSLGGMVATQIALQYPQKVSKLITVASNPSFISRPHWQYGMKPEVLQSFVDYLAEDYETTLIRFLGIQTMGSPTQKEDIKLLKETVFLHGQPSTKALRAGLDLLHDIDLTSEIKKLSMPVCRIYGRLDSLVPVKVVEEVDKRLPGSSSIIFRKAAHAPFLSATELFAQEIRQFTEHADLNSDYTEQSKTI